jgi:hypothetical protein
MANAMPSSPAMLRAHPSTPPRRSSLRSALEDGDPESRPQSSPYSDYYTDSAGSPDQDSHYSKRLAHARDYLFSDGGSHSTTPSSPPPFPLMSWTDAAPLSPTQARLLSYINNVERWVREHDPNPQQLASLSSSLEVINATITAPDPQTRQPAEELFDSGMFMSSADGRVSACSTPSNSFCLNDHSCVPDFLVANYMNEVMDLATELSKRHDETKMLNQLALDRIAMQESMLEKLRKANEKQKVHLHLDYSELVYLKMELNSIRNMALPQELDIETFEDAVRHFELNWRNTERRFAARLADTASGNSDDGESDHAEDGGDEVTEATDEQEEQHQTGSIFWGAFTDALDGFAQALGMFAAFED